MKLSLALAGTALLIGTLTACGGSSSDGGKSGSASNGGSSSSGGSSNTGGSSSNYCADLKSAAATFTSLSTGDASKLDQVFSTFDKLAAEAPGSIKADWAALDGAVQAVEKAFSDAGLKFADLGKIEAGTVPPGVDPSKLTGLVAQLSKLDTPAFDKASKAIEAHAKSTCKVNLNP